MNRSHAKDLTGATLYALATPSGFVPTRRRGLARHFVPASRPPIFEHQSSEARPSVPPPALSDNGPKLCCGCRGLRGWESPCILLPWCQSLAFSVAENSTHMGMPRTAR
jgi:hypothetical protein